MSKFLSNKQEFISTRHKGQFYLVGLVVWMFSCPITMAVETPPDAKAVIKTYTNIAHATYEDALFTAGSLNDAIVKLSDEPNEKNLKLAKAAWKTARVPYQQTEVFRFGNPVVDAWEGKVNAWPLDEGLIDYVSSAYGTSSDENTLYSANVIANTSIKLNGDVIDTSLISKTLIADKLHEVGGIEANVASGYHAIEFLLWGQDLNGTGPGAGTRPASDFDLKKCTGGNCDRRVAYLKALSGLLVDDLQWMVGQWAPSGAARLKLESGDTASALNAIFKGMGSLTYGELAGDRIKLGLLLHDPEEEHDCFSDNTHNSHYYDVIGIENIYLGRYKRIDGSTVKGPSPFELVSANDAKVGKALMGEISATKAVMTAIVKRAEGGEAYDQMIGEGNDAGNALINRALGALLKQTKGIERAVAALKLKPVKLDVPESLQ